MSRIVASGAVLGFALAVSPVVHARGPSPYLPLDLAPAMERQIERVLILAGKPVMRRPIAAATVLDAVPDACKRDRPLCEEVRRYLQPYTRNAAVTSLRPKVVAVAGDSTATLPNQHGEQVDSFWQVSASGYYQPNDYVILNAGGVAYDGNATATGTFASVGFDFAQLDIGFRDHWFSPSPDSSSLISTEAPTMPSATLSNYRPLTPLGFSYEIFFAQMSNQDNIEYFDTVTSGKPRLSGLQLAIEPVRGYALSVNRVTQFGGGVRNGGMSQFFDALFDTTNGADAGTTQEFGNQVASLNSSVLFPGKVPFAARIEYAGEDNAYKGKYRLGATNLTLGLDFPILWKNFDLSLEVSEWQDVWYVHHIYPDGLVNRGHVVGHWFGDNRLPNDGIGGNSQTINFGWQLPSGDYARATYRRMKLDPDWVGVGTVRPYDTLQTLGVNYATVVKGYPVEAEAALGQDIFGESFARVGLSLDFGRTQQRIPSQYDGAGDESTTTEVFVDVGAQRSEVREIMLDQGPNVVSDQEVNYHVGVGARRPVSARNDIGVRLELDRVAGGDVVSVRAIDYRFRAWRKLAIGGFLGAARYDIGLPAYGYYWGGGLQYVDVLPGWSVGVDFRHHDKFTRTKVLPSDPPYTLQLPRRVIDVNGVSLYLSKKW